VSIRSLGQALLLIDRLQDLFNRVDVLEMIVATTEDVLARIDAFTTGLGDDVIAIVAKVKSLQDAIASGESAAISSAMDELSPSISKMETIGAQLHSVASDPAAPIPVDSGSAPASDSSGAADGAPASDSSSAPASDGSATPAVDGAAPADGAPTT
jgi:hypothetical protein